MQIIPKDFEELSKTDMGFVLMGGLKHRYLCKNKNETEIFPPANILA
jgi:hypothetical protein